MAWHIAGRQFTLYDLTDGVLTHLDQTNPETIPTEDALVGATAQVQGLVERLILQGSVKTTGVSGGPEDRARPIPPSS